VIDWEGMDEKGLADIEAQLEVMTNEKSKYHVQELKKLIRELKMKPDPMDMGKKMGYSIEDNSDES
jgi:hypothetical protein